ncbi:MAG: hypothetical protein WDW36_000543 [Sanguina aurantia]
MPHCAFHSAPSASSSSQAGCCPPLCPLRQIPPYPGGNMQGLGGFTSSSRQPPPPQQQPQQQQQQAPLGVLASFTVQQLSMVAQGQPGAVAARGSGNPNHAGGARPTPGAGGREEGLNSFPQ